MQRVLQPLSIGLPNFLLLKHLLGNDSLFFQVTDKPMTSLGRNHVAQDWQGQVSYRSLRSARIYCMGLTEGIVEDTLCRQHHGAEHD